MLLPLLAYLGGVRNHPEPLHPPGPAFRVRPGQDGKPVRVRLTVDGLAPGDSHGTDIGADGEGTVTNQRLYQLVRQAGAVGDHTFEITFLNPGVQAFAFTFG